MKKRILSLLLLLCLLITGIPFAAVAAETSEPQAEESSEVRTEYHDLYVKKGLVGLFTAFAGDAGVSLSDGKGTWSNRVEKGASATFAGTTGWRFGTMGGVGYDLVRGQVNAEGAYSTTYSGDTFNNNNKLQLSLDLLPKDDFTLEYLASYTMLYVYDERVGNLVYALDAGVTSAQLKDSGYNYIIGNPVDVIGFMCSYTTYRGHSLDDVPGKMRWRSVDAGGYKKFDNDYGMGGYDFANRTTSDIATYALTRDESVTGAGETLVTKATYVHLRNFTSEKTISVTSETTYGSGRYFNKDDDTDFYLSDRLGTTFYALRVYDRVLDDSEMKHNRAVDALNFYAIEISEEKLSDENIMASIYSSMAGVALLSDASAYTAKKAELQETVDKITGKLLDVNKLYVQKGLVGLFTAFKGDTTVSLTNGVGTWTNRVSGGSSASFAGTAGWSMGKLGGVGFTVVRGQIAEDGTFMASYEGNTYDNNNKLVFDLSFLPKEDFTLEYVASYLPHYVYDVKTGELVSAYGTGNSSAKLPNVIISSPVDVIGFMSSYSTNPGNYFGDAGGYAALRWRTVDKAGYKTSWDNTYGMGNDFVHRASTAVSTYALTRDESATGEGDTLVTTAKYVHYLNRTAMKTINASSATTQGTGRYFNYDDDTEFYLSYHLGTTFYALRVYDRVLDDSEMKHNRAVDVINFYDVELPEELHSNENLLARFLDALDGISFESDATAYAAVQANIQTIIDRLLLKFTDLHQFYVKDGLVSLFTTFGDYADSVDLANGTWTDIVAGNKATFKYGGKNTWKQNANGSVGFTVFRGAMIDGAVSSNSSSTDTYRNVNNRLQFGIELLPESDFTVEYLAMYKPLYVYDASASDNIARDENGSKRETYNEGIEVGLHVTYEIDELGWFSSRASLLDTTKHYWSPNTNAAYADRTDVLQRGSVHWFYNCHYWSYNPVTGDSRYNNQYYVGSLGSHAPSSGLNNTKDAFQTNDVVRTYSISLDETLTVAADGKRTTTALFALYRNATLYNSNSSYLNTTERGEDAHGGYIDINTPYITQTSDTSSRTHDFWLSSTRATDFFGVRVYEKALTDAERRQNYAVDVMFYYGIDVPLALANDAAAMNRLAIGLARETLETDASAYAAARLRIQAYVTAETVTEDLTELYAAKENLTALFTTFYSETVDLASGTWTDFVGGNTAILGNKKFWHKNADGSIGYNIFYGTIGEDGAYTATSVYNNYSEVGTRLEFGIAALPKGDYTVEYVAGYHPVYLADAEGNIYTDKDGNKLETMSYVDNTPGNQQYGTNSVAPIDSLGFIQSWTTNRDGIFSGLKLRGGIYWCYGDLTKYSDAWTAYDWSKTFYNTKDAFYQRDSIHSYAITRNEEKDDTGLVTASYALLRDTATYASGTMSKTIFESHTSNKNGYTLDFAEDDVGYFYLAERLPVDFYGVRVYDVKLTDADRARNRLIDLVYYYDVALPEFVKNNDDVIMMLADTLVSVPFATDASTKAATKAQILAAIANIEKVSATSTLYVQNGLVALYTAFAGEGQYLAESGNNMLWTNRVLGGQKATFANVGWTYNAALGGVGYDLVRGQVDANGNYSATYLGNTFDNKNKLQLGLDLLPKGDFTLEYLASYTMLYVYDERIRELVYAIDAGVTADQLNKSGYNYIVGNPVDVIGFMCSYTTYRGHSLDNKTGKMRWRSVDAGGYKTWTNEYGMNGYDFANRTSAEIGTYALTRDESTTGEGNALVTEATYVHMLNFETAAIANVSTKTTSGVGRYYHQEDDTDFYLSDRLGTTFYALRIYDRVLSAEEQKQNRMADLIGYYGIAIPEDFFTNEERYEYVVSLCEELTFARDTVAYNANKRLLQTAAAGGGNSVTLIVDGVEEFNIVYGETYLLPTSVEGKTIFAWQLLNENGGHTSYAPGAILPLSGDDTLRALVFSAPVTQNGVTVKAMPENGFGMRFTAAVDKAEYLALVQEYGQDYIRMSMLITPKAYVDGAGGFTREKLTTYVNQKGGNVANSYVEILADGFYTIDEDVCTIAGTIYNFTEVTIAKKPAFAAIACIDVDTNKDGIVDKTVYGTYSSVTCRYPHQTIESLLYGDNNLTNTQREWVENFMKNYTDRTYGVAGVDKTVGEQRAEIEAAMNAALNTTVDYVVHEFAEGEVAEKYAHIKAISFDGLDSNGKKTRIFAYVGLPEGASPEDPVPAVVLVHGGGGHAYMEWVRLWNERGYAAIAMENTGYFPVSPGSCPIDSNATAEREFPDYILEVIDESEYVIAPARNTGDTAYKEVDAHWQYHGLSSVILSHNVLRQMAEVDSSRIGTVGVSWGGTMVTQVIGYDTRYAFAIPAYGSAYLGEPERPFGYYADAYIDSLWAAERNLNNFKNPIMWFAWADDNNFVISSYNKSYLQSLNNNSQSTLVLLADWRHSHNHVWNKEHGYAFADSICFPEKSASYAYFTSQPNGSDLTSAVALPAEATNVKVRLHYLTEPISYKTFEKYSGNYSYLAEYIKTDTKTATIDPATGKITGSVPAEMYYYYISVTYEVNGVSLETSSSFISVR